MTDAVKVEQSRIYVFSDDGRHIRKFDFKPFDSGQEYCHQALSTARGEGEFSDAVLKAAVTELLSHRGERPERVLHGGQELWETWLPAVRAMLRYLPEPRPSAPEEVAIPAGMKPWHGGDHAPEDWDGNQVFLSDGIGMCGVVDDSPAWYAGSHNGKVLAYTPKAPSDVPDMADEQRKGLADTISRYTSPVVSFDVSEPYYLASCDACGWVGSTELCPYSEGDAICPRCYQSGADCGKVAERIASTPAASVSAEVVERLRADAERWRAFISSERFYVMGWAGFTNDPEKPEVDPNRDPDNWLHFTLNIWDKHPAGSDRQGRHGRAFLLAYVEHLRARAALSSIDAPKDGDDGRVGN